MENPKRYALSKKGRSKKFWSVSFYDLTIHPLTRLYIYCISKSYSYRCGHCKRLKPEFQKAASVLAANDPPVTLAQVDCTDVGKDTCGRFEVSGYPTVKIFRNGELSSDYSGPREAGGIVKYMKAQVGPASKDCKSKDDLDKLLAKPEVVVVCYSKDAQDVFMKVANAMRENVAFGHTEAGDKEGIVLHRPKVSLFLNPNLIVMIKSSSN